MLHRKLIIVQRLFDLNFRTQMLFLTLQKLQLSTVCDDELLGGRSRLCAQLSHLLYHIHANPNPAEGYVFEVQVFGFLQGDEELRVVGVTPSIGHRQNTWACVSNIKVLILKFAAVDGIATGTVTVGDVTTLQKTKMFNINIIQHTLRQLCVIYTQ